MESQVGVLPWVHPSPHRSYLHLCSHWIFGSWRIGHPSGISQDSFRQVGQVSCLSLRLCAFPNLVHEGVKEGNLSSEFTDPNFGKCFWETGTPNVMGFLHLEKGEPFSLLACFPVLYGMDNNGEVVWRCKMTKSFVNIPWAHTVAQASQKGVA